MRIKRVIKQQENYGIIKIKKQKTKIKLNVQYYHYLNSKPYEIIRKDEVIIGRFPASVQTTPVFYTYSQLKESQIKKPRGVFAEFSLSANIHTVKHIKLLKCCQQNQIQVRITYQYYTCVKLLETRNSTNYNNNFCTIET